VLNASRRLAVIPKSFHGPLVDYGGETQIARTLEREMEEELFGRDDVDSVFSRQRRADPMHPSRLSPPMRWLVDHDDAAVWTMECTGYGYNLVSGNYEIPCLIAIHDDQWWTQFGGDIEANWESGSLRRYSTLDRASLTTLIHDPAWSNEGLFALLQGLDDSPRSAENEQTYPQSNGRHMADSGWYAGNANDDASQYRGWLLGHFIDPAHGEVRASNDVEIKWGVTPRATSEPSWTADDKRTTVLLLVSGRFRLDLTTGAQP